MTKNPILPILADGLTWLAVLGHIQLALRHPENTGPSADLMRGFSHSLLMILIENGVLTESQGALIVRDELQHGNKRTFARPATG